MFDKEYVSIDDDNCNDMIQRKLNTLKLKLITPNGCFIENCVLPSH